jgi:hypothetical protein
MGEGEVTVRNFEWGIILDEQIRRMMKCSFVTNKQLQHHQLFNIS